MPLPTSGLKYCKRGEMMDIGEILAEGELTVWQSLAEMIADRHEIKVLQQPETCMTMMQVLDSVGQTPFYVGEVLMTEATVSIDGIVGFGLAMEDDYIRALCAAIIDAALLADVAEAGEIRKAIADEEQRVLARHQQEESLIAATRVRFAIMEG
ncbi:alpha-D-ribose 1-methylphosphonate 5-triphosphate synthase subunit PhnG [Sporomusa sp. KB1]|nr:alpha-D-ribose 1-methylphosphonate 5-triphosphate synthase subunit PhnG [Sporomusa sp. KB1]